MKRKPHHHPQPQMPLLGGFYPDKPHYCWLENPWTHVAMIVAMLVFAGLLFLVVGERW